MVVRAIASASDARLRAELWYAADADGGASRLLGTADGVPPANAGLHLATWIDEMVCSEALAADGALIVRIQDVAGSSSAAVVESELIVP